MMIYRNILCAAVLAMLAGCSADDTDTTETAPAEVAEAEDSERARAEVGPELTVTSSDGATVYGTKHFAGLGNEAPLIYLFHQGGGSQGEYAPIVPWLNEAGFRAVTWDLRKGGELFGTPNRTAAGLDGEPGGFCDAYPDMEAVLLQTTELSGGAPVVIWGSSYSGALVFQFAAKHPGITDALIAFSPASGGPMVDCLASAYVDDLTVPAYVVHPASEMDRETSLQQQAMLETAGVGYSVVEYGVHGSSLLVDERTGHDMSEARAMVLEWLKSATDGAVR